MVIVGYDRTPSAADAICDLRHPAPGNLPLPLGT